MDNLGYHYRQTDIHSALIYSQMNRIEDFLNKRRKICEYYDNYNVHKNKFQKLSNDLKKEIVRDKNGFNYNLTKTIFKILS